MIRGVRWKQLVGGRRKVGGGWWVGEKLADETTPWLLFPPLVDTEHDLHTRKVDRSWSSSDSLLLPPPSLPPSFSSSSFSRGF